MNALARSRDLWAGLFFIGFAAGAFYFSSDLDLGTARQMGPRYFPAIIAGILLMLGSLVLVRGLKTDAAAIEPGRLRPALVLIAVLLFALTEQSLGFVVATSLMVIVGSYALPAPRVLVVLAAAAGLSLFVWLVFVAGLGLPLKAWPV